MVVEWEGLSFGASKVKREIWDYLERERSDESDMVLAEALINELLDNISRGAPKKASIELTWEDDGTAVLVLHDLRPTLTPKGIAPTEGWGLMIMSALNEALSVKPCHSGHGECLTAILPVRRKGS